jgi:hypothetical protein
MSLIHALHPATVGIAFAQPVPARVVGGTFRGDDFLEYVNDLVTTQHAQTLALEGGLTVSIDDLGCYSRPAHSPGGLILRDKPAHTNGL